MVPIYNSFCVLSFSHVAVLQHLSTSESTLAKKLKNSLLALIPICFPLPFSLHRSSMFSHPSPDFVLHQKFQGVVYRQARLLHLQFASP